MIKPAKPPVPSGPPTRRPSDTLSTIALSVAVAGLLASCGVDVVGDDPPYDQLHFPVGMALHPDGEFLYIVNSNFDVAYREDRGGSVVVMNTDELEIIPGGTVQIGTFGGDIKLNSVDGEPTRAYVGVRGDESVTVLDVEDRGSRLRCNGGRLSGPCQMPTDSADPFGLAVSTTKVAQPGGEDLTVDFVAVAHLAGGNITAFTVKGEGSRRSFSRVAAPLVAGANAIEQSPRTGNYYATSRFTNTIVSFRPAIDVEGDVVALFETDEIVVENASPGRGLDSRGIAFNREGTVAYVANRGPDAVLVIDVGPTNPATGGGTRNQIVDAIYMPADPAEVKLIEIDGRELLYVSSYDAEQIVVVDPESRLILDTIDIPGQPYTLTADTARHQRIYVSLFGDHGVAIVDIDPESPSFNQVTAVVR
jgi:DNA-binding beta-propeller fold protein YncE